MWLFQLHFVHLIIWYVMVLGHNRNNHTNRGEYLCNHNSFFCNCWFELFCENTFKPIPGNNTIKSGVNIYACACWHNSKLYDEEASYSRHRMAATSMALITVNNNAIQYQKIYSKSVLFSNYAFMLLIRKKGWSWTFELSYQAQLLSVLYMCICIK